MDANKSRMLFTTQTKTTKEQVTQIKTSETTYACLTPNYYIGHILNVVQSSMLFNAENFGVNDKIHIGKRRSLFKIERIFNPLPGQEYRMCYTIENWRTVKFFDENDNLIGTAEVDQEYYHFVKGYLMKYKNEKQHKQINDTKPKYDRLSDFIMNGNIVRYSLKK